MVNKQQKGINGLHIQMFSGSQPSFPLTQEISTELMSVTYYGMSMGGESLLQRAGVFVSRGKANYRFRLLRRKVARHIGRRKALIEIGNRYLSARGAEAVPMQADYGLTDCQADSDTSHDNTDWGDHMSDAYERMQASIEAVEADVSKCQDSLIALPA